jgi:hypothetical protein
MNVVRITCWKIPGLIIMTVAAIGLSPSFCRAADEPTSRPAAESPRTTPRRPRLQYTMAEWNEMMAFLYANSPNRAQVLDRLNLPDSAPIKQELIRKWRAYNFVNEHFPKLAEIHVQRYHLEDEIFGLMIEVRADPSHRPELRKSVRSRVEALAKLSIEERSLRIQRLQEMLTEEQLKLRGEQDRQGEIIDERMKRIFRNVGEPSSLGPDSDPVAQVDADHPDDAIAVAHAVVADAVAADSASLVSVIADVAID